MLAYYDHNPSVFESVGNGSIVYRYDIQDITSQEQLQWKCEEVIIWGPLTKKKILASVIADRWDESYELKLTNEYNSVTFGLITGEAADKIISNYSNFLAERIRLKTIVETDCDNANILDED